MPENTTAKYGLATYGLTEYGKIIYPVIIPDLDAKYGIGGYGRSAYGLVLTPSFADPDNKLFSLTAFGKISGDESGVGGIYQRMHTSKGLIIRKLKLYRPTNPRTETQQANRAKVASAVLAWKNLTDNEKIIYNERASGRHFSGYNLFIKEYLLSH